MKKYSFKKQIFIFFVCGALFFLGTYPLRDIFAVFTLTDVRPGIVLLPYFSICFGPAASLGCAVSNLIADAISGYPLRVLIIGLPFQFIYGAVAWYMWEKFTKGTEHRYRLNSTSKLLKFTALSFTFGMLCALGVGYLVSSTYGAHFFETAGFVLMNNFDTVMLLGCPLMIVTNLIISKKRTGIKRVPGTIESVILYESVVCALGIAVIIFGVYRSYAMSARDTYDLWNNIYIYCTIFINVIILSMLSLVSLVERRIKKYEDYVLKFE